LFRSVTGEERGYLALARGIPIATSPKKNFWRTMTGCRNLLGQFRGPIPPGMKAKIIITPKKAVLDPQGKTVQSALEHMGYTGVTGVHIGKYIEIDLAINTDKVAAHKAINDAAHKLLSNPVIEDYQLEIVD
jgi:phosphoribosylformylglycinamidine synthase